jgi:tRNA U34 2-thiouridine synthase MnmA/TrmU
MLKVECDACDKIIKEKEFRSSVYIDGETYFACEECNEDGTFKQFIDDIWEQLYEEDTQNLTNKGELSAEL